MHHRQFALVVLVIVLAGCGSKAKTEITEGNVAKIKEDNKAAIAYFQKPGNFVKFDEKSPGKTVIELILLDASDSGLVHLKGLTKLQFLDLSGTKITDAGLVDLKGLTNLEHLYLYGTKVTPDGIQKLQKALPKCKIYWDGK